MALDGGTPRKMARAIRRRCPERAIESCSAAGSTLGDERWTESPPSRNCSRPGANAGARSGRPMARASPSSATAAITASSACTTSRRSTLFSIPHRDIAFPTGRPMDSVSRSVRLAARRGYARRATRTAWREPWSIRVAIVDTGKGREIWRADPGRAAPSTLWIGEHQLFWAAGGRIVFPVGSGRLDASLFGLARTAGRLRCSRRASSKWSTSRPARSARCSTRRIRVTSTAGICGARSEAGFHADADHQRARHPVVAGGAGWRRGGVPRAERAARPEQRYRLEAARRAIWRRTRPRRFSRRPCWLSRSP